MGAIIVEKGQWQTGYEKPQVKTGLERKRNLEKKRRNQNLAGKGGEIMKNTKKVVREVIDYIEDNLEEKLDLDTISKKVGYSKFYLNRIFTECAGITIYKYMQNRRLTIAAKNLVESDKPIAQIAYEAGYDSQQAFSYAFKQVYLYPPKIYRDVGIFIPKQSKIFICYSYTSKYFQPIAKIKGAAA